jgi:hypothetical protein
VECRLDFTLDAGRADVLKVAIAAIEAALPDERRFVALEQGFSNGPLHVIVTYNIEEYRVLVGKRLRRFDDALFFTVTDSEKRAEAWLAMIDACMRILASFEGDALLWFEESVILARLDGALLLNVNPRLGFWEKPGDLERVTLPYTARDHMVAEPVYEPEPRPKTKKKRHR